MTRPCILVSNDDGIASPGIVALAHALQEVGDVFVVAPERNWSAVGHTKTMHKPLRAVEVEFTQGITAYQSSGSPSDCVALGILGLIGRPVDLVASGINVGANVGTDLLYSGTFAAAAEGSVSGIPAFAISMEPEDTRNWAQAGRFAAQLAAKVLSSPADPPWLLNANVPDRPDGLLAGVQVTRLGQRIYRDALVERLDPRGRRYFWIGGNVPSGVVEEGTDIGAVAAGFVSVTAIRLDLTDHRSRSDTVRRWGLNVAQTSKVSETSEV
jgi:5'-nucleotidase